VDGAPAHYNTISNVSSEPNPTSPTFFYDAHRLMVSMPRAVRPHPNLKPGRLGRDWGSLAQPIVLPGSYPRKGSSGVRGRGWLIADLNISDSPTPCMSSRAGYVCMRPRRALARMFASRGRPCMGWGARAGRLLAVRMSCVRLGHPRLQHVCFCVWSL